MGYPGQQRKRSRPHLLGTCWLQRAGCLRLEWQREPGQQGAHIAQPVEYVLFYVYHIVSAAAGLNEASKVLGGSWDLMNHYNLLQAQEFLHNICRDL